LCKTCSALHRRFSGFIPSEKLFPFALPEWLIRAGARLLSWGCGLSGSPSAEPIEKLLPSRSPSRPLTSSALRPMKPGTPGSFFQRLGCLPP
jgi:hypothetical protein